jgi:hypothetical protein
METLIVPMLAGIGLYLLISRRSRESAESKGPAQQLAVVDSQAGSASTPVSSFQPGGFTSTTPPLSAVGLGQTMSGAMGSQYNLLECNALYGTPTPSAQVTQAPGGSPVMRAANPAAPNAQPMPVG